MGTGLVVLPNWGFQPENLLPTLTIIIGMTAGTMFGVWLGQLITEQGIGNGVSLIIFAGILSSVPFQIMRLWQQPILLAIFIFITIATVTLIVWVQEGQRRIPVQYGKRVRTMRGNRMMMVGGQSTYVPLRVNTAGMIPLIFAQSLLILPSTIASYFVVRTGLDRFGGELVRYCVQPDELPVLAALFPVHGGVHLLLYGRHVPTAEFAGDAAEAGRLHSGHSTGAGARSSI